MNYKLYLCLYTSLLWYVKTMELKILQELVNVDQDLLFLVFLDFRKVYDNLDRGSLLHTLEGQGRKCRSFWRSSVHERRRQPRKTATMAPSSGWPEEPPRGVWYHQQYLIWRLTAWSNLVCTWHWRMTRLSKTVLDMRWDGACGSPMQTIISLGHGKRHVFRGP